MKFCNILSLVALLILPNLLQITSSITVATSPTWNNTISANVVPLPTSASITGTTVSTSPTSARITDATASAAGTAIKTTNVPDSSSIYTTNDSDIRSSSTSVQVPDSASKATYVQVPDSASKATYAQVTGTAIKTTNGISPSTYADPYFSTIVTNRNSTSISPTTHSSFHQAVSTINANINANINASQTTDVMRSSTNTTKNGNDDGLSTAQIAAIAGGCGAAVIILITIPIVWRLKSSARQGSGTIHPLHNVEENAEMEIVDGNEQEAKNK